MFLMFYVFPQLYVLTSVMEVLKFCHDILVVVTPHYRLALFQSTFPCFGLLKLVTVILNVVLKWFCLYRVYCTQVTVVVI